MTQQALEKDACLNDSCQCTLTELMSLTDGEKILALLLYSKENHSEEDASGSDFHSQLQQKQCAERPLLHRLEAPGYRELSN